MYKIAVLGDRDSIYGFAALGLDVCPVSDVSEGAKELRRLTEGDYAVIYITEALAANLKDEIEQYADRRLPAIILIPGVSGNTGLGMMNVKRSVERAVGSDILSNSENEKAGEK